MKLTKILLAALVTLAFTTTTNAEGYKFGVCKRAETSFWDTIVKANNSADQSFVESLGKKDQIAYYKTTLGEMKLSISEVKNRCKGVASKDIVDAYEKKKSEIQDKLYAL